MLGLSFNTKSNVPVFEVFKCQNIIYLLFTPSLTISTQNKMFCITSRRYGDNAKQHRFYYIFKQSSVFFHMFDRLFFIMINEQAALSR